MSFEPRFGSGSQGGESLGQTLLRAQATTERTLGRVEASIDHLKAQNDRLEKGLDNMGRRLEHKIDEAARNVADRDARCREHDARLAALEHDKSRIMGARWAVRLIWTVLSALGIGGVAVLVSWLNRLLAQG